MARSAIPVPSRVTPAPIARQVAPSKANAAETASIPAANGAMSVATTPTAARAARIERIPPATTCHGKAPNTVIGTVRRVSAAARAAIAKDAMPKLVPPIRPIDLDITSIKEMTLRRPVASEVQLIEPSRPNAATAPTSTSIEVDKASKETATPFKLALFIIRIAPPREINATDTAISPVAKVTGSIEPSRFTAATMPNKETANETSVVATPLRLAEETILRNTASSKRTPPKTVSDV